MAKTVKLDLQLPQLEAIHQELQRLNKQIARLGVANQERDEAMADTLDDVRGNLTDLGVDVDAAVSGIQSLRTDLESALMNAGVDESARAEIMATIDAQQQKLFDALNPSVPVDPNTPPVEIPEEPAPE